MNEPRDIWIELYEGDHIVSGSALIWRAPEVPREVIEREVNHAHGEGWDRLVVEVQHLTFTPRVKWCSRHDGFGCDSEGDWHAHWFGVKHNPLSDCCHTIALPVWTPRYRPAGEGGESRG